MKKHLLAACALLILAGPSSAEPVRLIFAGDIMLDDGPGRSPVEAIRWRISMPVCAMPGPTIGNLECPIATVGQALESKIFRFSRSSRRVACAQGRFDALALANNHSGDFGKGRLCRNHAAP